MVRLLLSIDRREDAAAAMATVQLAAELSPSVVGIDLSGQPYCGYMGDLGACPAACPNLGLRLTIHAAEVSPTAERV